MWCRTLYSSKFRMNRTGVSEYPNTVRSSLPLLADRRSRDQLDKPSFKDFSTALEVTITILIQGFQLMRKFFPILH